MTYIYIYLYKYISKYKYTLIKNLNIKISVLECAVSHVFVCATGNGGWCGLSKGEVAVSQCLALMLMFAIWAVRYCADLRDRFYRFLGLSVEPPHVHDD